MAELIDPSRYQDFTLEMLRTPDGITKLNSILRQLSQNISGDTETVRVYSGVGTPEASVAAGVGSLYMRTDGGSDTSVYRKESGSGDTGWVAVKSPASLPLSTANGGLGADASGWTSGDYLYLSSTGVIGHIALSTQRNQLFTSSGTFTAPTGVTKVYLTMIGGGGGGGGSDTAAAGGGGGAGAWVINYPFTVTPGNNYTVTIGAGGAGSTGAGNPPGSTGGTTSFDTVSVLGGGGGNSGGGNGGTGAGGYDASASVSTAGTTGGGFSGKGGNGALRSGNTGGGGGGSPFGTGANGASTLTNGNNAAANTGAGGGGSGNGGGIVTGGNGGSGLVLVEW